MFRLSFLLLTLIVPALSAIPTTPDSIKAIRHGSRYRETSAGRLSKDLPPLKPKMPNAFTKSIGPWASPLPPVPPGEGYTGTIAFLTASNESITVPAFGQITAEYENYEYSQTYYSLVITSMTGGLFTKGDRLGLQQTGVNYDFLAGPGYLELRPVIPSWDIGPEPSRPPGHGHASGIWTVDLSNGQLTAHWQAGYGEAGTETASSTFYYNPSFQYPRFTNDAGILGDGWEPITMYLTATTHLPPPPPTQTGRLIWQHADGTFFTESQTSLTDVTVAFYPPPSTSSYGDLHIISGFDSNSWLNGLCLGLHADRNGAIGVGPYFQYGSAILDVGGVELTTGDQPSAEGFGVDYFYSSKVWSLDPMTNQLSIHWNYAIGSPTPIWFSTSMFWIWPAGQSDPYGDGYPWVTNDPSIPTEPFLGQDRIPVGMYFFPDDSIVFNGPPQNYPWY